MKVLVLGGAGGMGRVAAIEAAAYPFVQQVTVADLDAAAAAAVAGQCQAPATGLGLNINDRPAMAAAIAAHDIVLNAVGPFYTFGLNVLEQVLDAGRHYVDICDDWEPTLDMLALGPKARERGVTAVIGMGASPGVTNLIALKVAQALDEVDDLVTCWSIEGSDEDLEAMRSQHSGGPGASAAVVHWVQQLTGTIRVLSGGEFRDVKPLQPRKIRYPGVGDITIWSVGHPEAVTLPRVVPGLLDCVNAMVGPTESFDGLSLIANLVDSGALSIHQAADAIVEDMRAKADAPRPPKSALPPLFAWARGRRKGKSAIAAGHVKSLPAGGMAGATSVPFTRVLPLFQDGRLGARHGVFVPEEVIDPVTLLDELAPRCVGAFPSAEALFELTVEEQDS